MPMVNSVTKMTDRIYRITELGSMAENAAEMGAPVPQWLLTLLEETKKPS